MRKIERQMNQAIRERRNWSGSNTMVMVDHNNKARVYLHGNLIAEVCNDFVAIFDGPTKWEGFRRHQQKQRIRLKLPRGYG